jgi:hypothetical protein
MARPGRHPGLRPSQVINVATAPERRPSENDEWVNHPYVAVGGNYMNCVYDVLTAFGAHLLDPSSNPALWTPNDWFNNLHGVLKPA